MNIIMIGAHPDDCEIKTGGTAIQLAEAGHNVKFISVTNGDAGHQTMPMDELAARRKEEVRKSAEILGVTAEVLDIHDEELMCTLENRHMLIRKIREWEAEVVISHRANDYHPDHRYCGELIQDTAYTIIIPKVCPDTVPLPSNPIYLYMSDRFQTPSPFRPDIIVPTDEVFEKKVCALHMFQSQFYEWLPWTNGTLDEVPEDGVARRAWLRERFDRRDRNRYPEQTAAMYGDSTAQSITHAEAFQICEYGHQPNRDEIRDIFPFLPSFVNGR